MKDFQYVLYSNDTGGYLAFDYINNVYDPIEFKLVSGLQEARIVSCKAKSESEEFISFWLNKKGFKHTRWVTVNVELA